MNMLPMTKIRELCLHAAGHARRHFDAVLDGSRFEARDRDGHVFQGHETLSEEILSGETIYLVEGGLDVRGAAKAVRGSKGAGEKPKTSARERGRLLCLKSLELEGDEKETKTPYRTPSVSSRASSSRSESNGRAGQPRMTASQKALAIAQMGRTSAPQELIVGRKLQPSSAVRKSLPSPALEKVGESAGEGVRDGGSHVGEPAELDGLEATLVAASPLRSSFPPPQQPQSPPKQQAVPPNLQDSQLVIPDSQDPFSQGLFSQQSVEPDHAAPALPAPDTSNTQKAQSRPSPRVNPTTVQPKLQMSRPDPYDINTVLSDDENEHSDGSNNNTTTNIKMASSVRKLGSATTRRRSVAPPPVSLPSPRPHQSNDASPLRAKDATFPAVASKKATPTKKGTPIKADPSSPAVPLPSSPTTHVAAAIAKGRHDIVGKGRRPSLPSPGQLVYRVPSDSDSDDDLIEEAFRDLSGSIPAPSLPWSAPPLRAAPDVETGVDNQLDPSRSTAGDVKYGTLMGEVSFVGVSPKKSHQKSPVKSPLKKPLGQCPSPGKRSSQKSPTKTSMTSIITSPSKREEATMIQDSSSAEESDHEKYVRIVKEEPPSREEGSALKMKLADIPDIEENHQHVEEKQREVIEISSGSDSDIEPSTDMLEDDEAELPSIDVELLTKREQLPALPRSPVRANQSPTRKSLKTDPVKIEPALKEPPPSAQASKRKRPSIEEPDPEDEQHRRKRLRREARKAGRKHNREQKTAMLLQEEREKQLAALQEERKKLALEKAHRRALELEIIVSSPIKRESSIDLSEEGDDDDSGLGSSPHGDDASADVDGVGVPLDGDDKNDSLSSKESEGHRPSWRRVSKLHLSSSPPKDSQGHLAVPPTSTPAIIEAQLQQCVEERFHRMPFDDWAFLENTLGKGLSHGHGYSTLEVHNRVHLDMMHRAQHPPPHTSAKRESSNAHATDQAESKSAALPDQAGDGGATARSRCQRSEAPSPKEHRAAEEEETARTREEPRKERVGNERAKTLERLQHQRARKKERGKKANRRFCHVIRGTCARNGKMKKQRHK